MVQYGRRRNYRAFRPRPYRRARRYNWAPRIRGRRRLYGRYANFRRKTYRNRRARFKKIRRGRSIITSKMLARTKGTLTWIKGYPAFFTPLYNGQDADPQHFPSEDGLYTAIRILTKTCWAAARYIYKYRRKFRVFPKLYEINRPQQDRGRIRHELSEIPASLSVSKEFYTITRLMRKPNPRSEDWRNMMNAHQNYFSLAILITASAITTTKLENLLHNLFPNRYVIILGYIVLCQLEMIKTMTQEYNITKLTGMLRRMPEYEPAAVAQPDVGPIGEAQ